MKQLKEQILVGKKVRREKRTSKVLEPTDNRRGAEDLTDDWVAEIVIKSLCFFRTRDHGDWKRHGSPSAATYGKDGHRLRLGLFLNKSVKNTTISFYFDSKNFSLHFYTFVLRWGSSILDERLTAGRFLAIFISVEFRQKELCFVVTCGRRRANLHLVPVLVALLLLLFIFLWLWQMKPAKKFLLISRSILKQKKYENKIRFNSLKLTLFCCSWWFPHLCCCRRSISIL